MPVLDRFRLDDRVVIVTGASSGLGVAFAKACAEAGIALRTHSWFSEAMVENGRVTYSLPHQAKVVTDSAGTELFLEYKGRKVADA